MARTASDDLKHRRLAGMTTDERAEFDAAYHATRLAIEVARLEAGGVSSSRRSADGRIHPRSHPRNSPEHLGSGRYPTDTDVANGCSAALSGTRRTPERLLMIRRSWVRYPPAPPPLIIAPPGETSGTERGPERIDGEK
jgi:hypothetical protein